MQPLDNTIPLWVIRGTLYVLNSMFRQPFPEALPTKLRPVVRDQSFGKATSRKHISQLSMNLRQSEVMLGQ